MRWTEEDVRALVRRAVAAVAGPAVRAHDAATAARCSVCGRKLTGEKSVAAGVGPTCARKACVDQNTIDMFTEQT